MPDINILSPHVADLIAAGEVVERPASVVKELLENSFDAGAKNITVEIKDGGMSFIRVTDDGSGMLPEDAGICIMRHATSKLHDERGLEAIGTLGFRGEALAAISAVSHIELITRKRGLDSGVRITAEAGEIKDMSPCGCPEGSTLIVRRLFHNTPARQKFMKSDRAEGSACLVAALRCALGRPEISVGFIKDGKDEFFSPGDGRISSCIYALLGRELSLGLLEMNGANEDMSVMGYIGSPKSGHGNRSKQYFFVGGRCIKSPLIQSAVEQAYKNTMLSGRFPSAVIYLEISPAAVDVNVHPAKTEVRFHEERRIFDLVYYATLSALEGESPTAEATLSPSTKAAIAPKKDYFRSMNSDEFRNHFSSDISKGRRTFGPQVVKGEGFQASELTDENLDARQPKSSQLKFSDSSASSYTVNSKMDIAKATQPPTISDAPTAPLLIGEFMKTYILIEEGESLILIDKHAAHERMIFDNLKALGHEIMSQSLLSPITMNMSTENMEIIELHLALLERFGFDIDQYGDDSIILRGVPADTDSSDAPAMIEEICEKLRQGVKVSETDTIDDILQTVACKAAVKAGYITSDEELLQISDAVVSGQVKYCPHGRPLSLKLTKKQFDKEFSRIV